jgi:hypothetical protein
MIAAVVVLAAWIAAAAMFVTGEVRRAEQSSSHRALSCRPGMYR